MSLRQSGTLWQVCQPGLMGVKLNLIGTDARTNLSRYTFEKVVIIEKQTILLYLGDELFQASTADIYNAEAWGIDVQFDSYQAAAFLVNEQKLFIFYNDYYNLWDKDLFFKSLK
jgi:hypothetical protein